MWRARELEDLIECWTLDEADLGLIANKSGATRLGFALALKFFEQEARFPRHAGELPPAAGEVRSGPGQGRSGHVRRVRVVGSDGRVSRSAAQGRAGLPREPVVGDEDKLADWLAAEACPAEPNRDRHLRFCGVAAIAGGGVAAAAGFICLSYGAYGWAAFFLVLDTCAP